jgi:DNA-binding response OmpR family regulator
MKKVLIVEDDPFIRDITTIKLSEHGYSVISAANGEDALASLDAEAQEVVILDLDLPGISGLEVLTHMRETTDLKNVPVIIFSNNDNVELREKVTSLGVSGFFVKASTEYDELYRLIDSL